MYEHIEYDVADSILTITLNRPHALNAFTNRMMDELIDAFDRSDVDDDIRVVIVTGRGRAFCAGADLAGGADTFNPERRSVGENETASIQTDEDPTAIRDGGGRVTLRIYESLKPVIGAINGPAVGVGSTMTLPMDIRMAAQSARMGFVFARRGITMEAASSWFLPRLVGMSQAAEWVHTGRVFSAEEALAGGLIRSIHPDGELIEAATALAREIADNTSAVSTALNRQMLWRMAGADHPMEAHKIDSRAIYAMGSTADVREGVVSFLEKRPPRFTMQPSKDMPGFFPWWQERLFE